MKNLKVKKLTVASDKYDVLLAGANNESRATFIDDVLAIKAKEKYCIEYECPNNKRVDKIKLYFKTKKYRSVHSLKGNVRTLLGKLLKATATPLSRICVDITCLSREDLGLVVEFCSKIKWSTKPEIHFVYSLAQYSPPPDDVGPIMHLGPITPFFSGWSSDPTCPSSLVLGIGYEPDLALGLMERLEPSRTFAFRPTGHDHRYTKAIDEKNSAFLTPVPKATVFDYNILDPLGTYTKLESLVYSELRDNRVVIAPFGLKSMALCSYLVAARYLPQVAIWGIKPEIMQKTEDRLPSGKWVGLSVKM